MKPMSTNFEVGGRSAQKHRTREALLAAARTLIADGVTPTVDEAATAAAISRTTAYRYFPNRRALLLAAHPEVGQTSMLPPDPPEDPYQRLDAVVRNFTTMIADTEPQQRTMLRLSLEADPADRGDLPLRQGRAIRWLTEALEGLGGELTAEELRLLVLAVRATTGIEALVWLTDVAGLSPGEAGELMRWSSQALLHRSRTHPPSIDATPLRGPSD